MSSEFILQVCFLVLFPIFVLIQKQLLEVFCKKTVFRNFAKLTGKHLSQRLFLNKFAGLRPAILLKKSLSYSRFAMKIYEILKKTFLQNTSLGCFYLIPRSLTGTEYVMSVLCSAKKHKKYCPEQTNIFKHTADYAQNSAEIRFRYHLILPRFIGLEISV